MAVVFSCLGENPSVLDEIRLFLSVLIVGWAVVTAMRLAPALSVILVGFFDVENYLLGMC